MEKVYRDEVLGDVILRKNPKSRRIGIRVHQVKGISVSIPCSLSYEQGLAFLESKKEWLVSAVDRQHEKKCIAEASGKAVPAIVDGLTVHTLLSEIVFSQSDSLFQTDPVLRIASCHVEDLIDTGRLFFALDRPVSRKEIIFQHIPPSELHNALVKLIRAEAKALLSRKLEFFAEKYGFKYRSMTIKHNSTNWGSCSNKGNINLNLNLMRLPEPLCDYVILHELSHLRHPDHGVDFHSLLSRLCDDNLIRLASLGEPCSPVLQSESAASGRSAEHILRKEISRYVLI